MAAPTASALGSNRTSAGVADAILPVGAPAIGDRAILVIAHRDNAVGTPTPSDTAGFGTWSQVSGSPVVQGAARLTVWEAIVESTTPTAPSISDSGDHQQSRCFYVSHPDGTPLIHATSASVDATSDTSGNATSPTTSVADCLVMLFAASDTPDLNNTAEFSAVANGDLTSVAELADNAVATGLGSGKLIGSGVKAAAGSITDWTYTKANAGVKAHLVVAFSPPAVGETFFGSFALPMTFGKDFNGQRKTFGQFAFPITFGKAVAGFKQTFAQFALPISFGKAVAGSKQTFAQFAFPITFGKAVAGQRTTFSQFTLPVVFGKDIKGILGTYGQFSLLIVFGKDFSGDVSTGPQTHFGAFHLPITLDRVLDARKHTFAQFSAPIGFGSSINGQRQVLASFSLPITVGRAFGPGHLTVHGIIDLDLLVGISTRGIVGEPGVVLNDALAVYLGEIEVVAVYAGDIQVWP